MDTDSITTTSELEERFARSFRRVMKNVLEPLANGTYKRNPNASEELRAKMKRWQEEAESEQ